ncbi:hypothetical protein GOB57_21935 [Sinorhizobium meliloti]|nr:hypothetical protein [Sinorhizobium meliloti]
MASIYLVNVEGQVRGTSENLGDAIECLFRLQLPHLDGSALTHYGLEGTGLEGTKYDLMARELYKLKDHTAFISVHELGAAPIPENRTDCEIDFSRVNSPTASLQQAIYDVAEGYDADEIRQRLSEDLEEMVPTPADTFEEAETFLLNARRIGRVIGASFSEDLLDEGDRLSRSDINFYLDSMVEDALCAFDNAIAPKSPVPKGRRSGL